METATRYNTVLATAAENGFVGIVGKILCAPIMTFLRDDELFKNSRYFEDALMSALRSDQLEIINLLVKHMLKIDLAQNIDHVGKVDLVYQALNRDCPGVASEILHHMLHRIKIDRYEEFEPILSLLDRKCASASPDDQSYWGLRELNYQIKQPGNNDYEESAPGFFGS